MDVILYKKIQETDNFLGDKNADIGTHGVPVTNDIIDIAATTETVNSVVFTQTKNVLTVKGTASNNFFRTLQDNIHLKAGREYYFAIDSVVVQGYIINLNHGADIVTQFTPYNNIREYTFTPDSDMDVNISYFMSATREVDDTKTFTFTEKYKQQVENTVASAVHDQVYFVGDTDTDLGTHKEIKDVDLIDIAADTATINHIEFIRTKNTIKVEGTASANTNKTLQMIPVKAGYTYTFSVDHKITQSYQFALYNGSTLIEHFWPYNNLTSYTFTPESDFTAELLFYTGSGNSVDDETVISFVEHGPQDVDNTVADALGFERRNKTYFVDASGLEMLVMWKMPGANNKDVGVKLKTFDKNDCYQFCSFGTVDNNKPYVCDDPSKYVEYMSTGEDIFGPAMVYAKENIDGDLPITDKWSGGLHTYDDHNSSRRVSLDIYFDGRKKDGFVGYCNVIDIVIVHQDIASNTWKTDGTGREVLKETIKMHFENGVVNIETTFTALEPVEIRKWYFLQGHHKANGLGSGGIRYIGGDANRGINSMDEASNGGDLFAKTMRFLSTTLQMEMHMEDFDLGRLTHNGTETYAAFVANYTTYTKAYFKPVFDTVNPLTLDTGETASARGYYKFGIFE